MNQANVYELEKSLQEYLLFHYGSTKDTVQYSVCPTEATNFPKRCADLCVEFANKDCSIKRALDIGCAVGRSSFELTSYFDEVIGIDYSQQFVDACNRLKSDGHVKYKALLEGDLYQDLSMDLDPAWLPQKAIFERGDACDLRSDLGQFGCILAANLICRLHNPVKFLSHLSQLVSSGGILVITSPYSFSTEFTPKENWIGGYINSNGLPVSGFDGLHHNLDNYFDLIAEREMPFLIRETRRKHQLTIAHATVWRRNDTLL